MNEGNLLGHEVLAAIIQQGYTNKEVAITIDISPQYLGDLIMNRRTPSDEVLERLIKHLHLNRNYAYYLVNRYPPEMRNKDISLVVLDKALDWIAHPHNYTLRKVDFKRASIKETLKRLPVINDPVITDALKDVGL